MLREYSQFFKNLLVLLDLSLLSLCWLVSYLIIEASGFMPDEQSRGSIYTHTMWVLPIWCIWIGVFRAFNLYRPRRIPSDASELWDITKGCTLTSLGVSTLSLFLNQPFSRPSLIVFWLIPLTKSSSPVRWRNLSTSTKLCCFSRTALLTFALYQIFMSLILLAAKPKFSMDCPSSPCRVLHTLVGIAA